MQTVAVIPSYNVGEKIREVVERSKKHVDHVIVVDDGSLDNTYDEAIAGGAEVIKFKKNKGKASAIKKGLAMCKNYDVIVILDGDLQHIPEEIPFFLNEIRRGYDLVIGNRIPNSNMPIKCKFSNKIASMLITALMRKKISDPQCGFRALKGEKSKILDLRAERYAIEHIMLLEASKKKFKIKEIPISCVYKGEKSSIKPVRDTIKVAYYILRFLIK
jgi:glycosyltransferase involved in cell wall biosynthesis